MKKKSLLYIFFFCLLLANLQLNSTAYEKNNGKVYYHLEENELQLFLEQVGEVEFPEYSFVKDRTKFWKGYHFFIWDSLNSESILPDKIRFDPKINEALIKFYNDNTDRKSQVISGSNMVSLSLEYLMDEDYSFIKELKDSFLSEDIPENKISFYIIKLDCHREKQTTNVIQNISLSCCLEGSEKLRLFTVPKPLKTRNVVNEFKNFITSGFNCPPKFEFKLSGIIQNQKINDLLKLNDNKLLFKETFPRNREELTMRGKSNSGNEQCYPYVRFTFFNNKDEQRDDISSIKTNGIWIRISGKDTLITNTSIFSQILDRYHNTEKQLEGKKFNLFFARTSDFGSGNVELTRHIKENELRSICEEIKGYIDKLKKQNDDVSPKICVMGFANKVGKGANKKAWIKKNKKLAKRRAETISDWIRKNLKYKVDKKNIISQSCPNTFFNYDATHVEIRIYH